jgi:dTDP-glucose 4,6-dehydratase
VSSILVTGAAGFIGSNLVHYLRRHWPERPVVSLDALTYAGNLETLATVADDPLHTFVRADICDRDAVRAVLTAHDITGVFHLAAESHVDRSIVAPLEFVRTNVMGTVVLLQEVAHRWNGRSDVLFHHVSTDEVFGSLDDTGFFDETTSYAPRSPYSASKAASDHFVRAWHETYGLPVVVTNCTNNYGPYQFPEKLIPVVITRALAGEPVPVYGQGANVRDWLYVEDHCSAMCAVFSRGRRGATYCIGGEAPVRNLDLVHLVLDAVDEARGATPGSSRQLIRFVADRPGHDYRYAMDISRIRSELGWSPSVSLAEGIRRTVAWYLANRDFCERARSGQHRDFEKQWYEQRLRTAVPAAAGAADEES